MIRTYMVIYERMAEDNWGGWAPDIDGAVGAGDSLSAARESLREGIAFMLEDLVRLGHPIPDAKAKGFDFSELGPDPSGGHFEIEWETVELPLPMDTLETRQAA